MALQTPLARPSSFLFPSHPHSHSHPQSRHRVSALPPPPTPDERNKRRRSALLYLSDSPPKCRRRLSFADSDISSIPPFDASSPPPSPPSPPPSPSPLSALAADFTANFHAEIEDVEKRRVETWKTIALELRKGVNHMAIIPQHQQIIQLFYPHLLSLLTSSTSSPTHPSKQLLSAFEALPHILHMCRDDPHTPQIPLLNAALSVLISYPQHCTFVNAIAQVASQEHWVDRHDHSFVMCIATHGQQLVQACITGMQSKPFKVGAWRSYVLMLVVCCRAAWSLHMGITEMPTPTAILAVRHPVWSFQFDDIHAQVILDSLRRMASLDVSATHFVLKQLVTLLEDKAIVKIFNSMKANSSAILKEVSDMFVDSPDIQRDCVELLLCLADCR